MQASLATRRTTIKLLSRVDPMFSRTVDTLILPAVTSYQPSVQTVRANWTHLFGVHMADSYKAFQTPIELLLGADIFAKILHDGIRRGPVGTPLAQQTALGWILSGPISNGPPARSLMTSGHLHVYRAAINWAASRNAGGTSPSSFMASGTSHRAIKKSSCHT